jgi:hypothetical protein
MYAASVKHHTATQFVCVDTWLGSSLEFWLNPDLRKQLMIEGGYPTMFRQFVVNLVAHGADRAWLRTRSTSTPVMNSRRLRPTSSFTGRCFAPAA